MRVGRAALDEDAIRHIEELNPSIEFDWPRILKGQGDPQQERRQEPRHQEQRPEHAKKEPPTQEPRAQELKREEDAEKDGRAEPVSELVTLPAEPEPEIPAHARIGVDGVARLRARYSEVLTRVAERVTDPVRLEELKARAERLNPDSWVTDQEVVQGLEEYESTLAALQSVVGRKRRRRRRGRRPAEGSTAGAPPVAGEAGEDEDELSGAEDDEGEDSPGPSDAAPDKPEEL